MSGSWRYKDPDWVHDQLGALQKHLIYHDMPSSEVRWAINSIRNGVDWARSLQCHKGWERMKAAKRAERTKP